MHIALTDGAATHFLEPSQLKKKKEEMKSKGSARESLSSGSNAPTQQSPSPQHGSATTSLIFWTILKHYYAASPSPSPPPPSPVSQIHVPLDSCTAFKSL